jgi:type VI secretion system secreted protein VgrG
MARSIRPPVFRRSAAAIGLATVLALSFGSAAHADVIIDGPVNLGEAADFGVLGDESVTNTGPTVVDGDVGLDPGTSVTGFTEGPGTIENGSLYINDDVAAAGQRDASIAYEVARSLTPQESNMTQLDGRSLSPGVYSGGELNLAANGDLAFAGSAASVWVMQASSTLTIGEDTEMTFSGGASACNVFWQVGSSATILEDADFFGTILAQESITAVTGATFTGRLLALTGSVTLDTNTIDTPETCAAVGTPIVTSTPSITTDAPDDGTVGTEYVFDIDSDGTPESSYTIIEGALPPGLTIDDDSGVISGTPSTPGTFDFTVEADNGDSVTDTEDYTIGIVEAAVVPAPSDSPSPTPSDSDGGPGDGSGSGSGGSGEPLAVTGSDTSAPAIVGALALLAGIALTVTASRQRRAARSAR